MLAFLGSNLATIVVTLLVLAALGLAVYKMIRDKREGKRSCSCGGCSGCSGCSCGCAHSKPEPRN